MNFDLEMLAEQAYEYGFEWGPSVVSSILILLVGRWIAKRVVAALSVTLKKKDFDPTLTKFFLSLTNVALQAVIVISALDTLGIETTSFMAILGAAGLAIGLALKDTLGNLASGVMIIFFRPFKVGDFVDAAGVSGTVKSVGMFTTQLTTGDNKLSIVPNQSITGGTITNFSAMPTRRVDLVFGIGYDDDLRKAKEVLAEIVANTELALTDPEPMIAVSELADSSVNFVVRVWVNSADYWKVYFGITETVKLRFDEEGISIPYPQTDVHLYSQNQG